MSAYSSGSLAAFVKTPGLSPIKTRLAASMGRNKAEEFHILCAQAVFAVLAEVERARPDFHPHWAVAEEAGLASSYWQQMKRVFQGSGDLSDRLSEIYTVLIQNHGHVILIGADSPQIPVEDLIQTHDILVRRQASSVLGEARDGGFYLFGSSLPLGLELWKSVPYSQSDTAAHLREKVVALGPLVELPIRVDVDSVGDLVFLEEELSRIPHPLPEQVAVRKWIEAQSCEKLVLV